MARWQSTDPLWNQLQGLQGGGMWRQLQNLQQEFNRVFDRWGGEAGGVAAGAYPAVNVWEEGDTLTLEAELPGVAQDKLEILVTGENQLTIKGERQIDVAEKGVWHRRERGSGAFVRTLTLPFDVDRDNVDARLENGVLILKLAKHVSAKPRKINVKAE
jgi:HSP20 family protein